MFGRPMEPRDAMTRFDGSAKVSTMYTVRNMGASDFRAAPWMPSLWSKPLTRYMGLLLCLLHTPGLAYLRSRDDVAVYR